MTANAFLSIYNWTWIEGVFTFITAGATWRAWQVLHETRMDKRELDRRALDGELREIVESAQFSEFFRLLVKLCFLAVGLWAGFTKPTPVARNVSLVLVMAGVLFMYAQGEMSIRAKRRALRAQNFRPHVDKAKPEKKGDDEDC